MAEGVDAQPDGTGPPTSVVGLSKKAVTMLGSALCVSDKALLVMSHVYGSAAPTRGVSTDKAARVAAQDASKYRFEKDVTRSFASEVRWSLSARR